MYLSVSYDILFGMIETDVSALFVVNNDTVTRGHNLKLFVQKSRIDVRKYFFSNRVIQCFNSCLLYTSPSPRD